MSEEITETIGTSVWSLRGIINIQVTFHGPRMSHTLSISTDREDKGIEAVSRNKKVLPMEEMAQETEKEDLVKP